MFFHVKTGFISSSINVNRRRNDAQYKSHCTWQWPFYSSGDSSRYMDSTIRIIRRRFWKWST